MPFYKPCPNCGANNDPGESCDCRDENEAVPLQRKRPHEKVAVATVPLTRPDVKECGAHG